MSQVNFDRWHRVQEDFILSPAKRKSCVAGRRGGKTTGVANLALYTVAGFRPVRPGETAQLYSPAGVGLLIDEGLVGRRVLEAAPTSDQTLAFWDHAKRLASPLLEAGLAEKSETYRLIEFWNGGRIRTKTAHNADTLRGDYADLLILDEFSYMDPDAWDKVGAPMLLDNDGAAAFTFTPNRRNHAYARYVKALADTTGRWAAFKFTSLDNPYLSAAALAEIAEDMTEEDYEQEILAVFLPNEGAVFRHIGRCLIDGTSPQAHKEHTIVMGVDWGKKVDYTAASVGCLDCRRELALDRFKLVDYTLQRGRLAALAAVWGVDHWLVELNSIGEPNFELLRDAGFPVEGFTTSSSSKGPLIDGLALSIEACGAGTEELYIDGDVVILTDDTAGIYLLDDPVAKAELESYEAKYHPVTGRATYSAPAGVHDDTVIARALMARAINTYQPALI